MSQNSSKRRTGRWSNQELELVNKYADEGLTYEQMSIRLAQEYDPEGGFRDPENIKQVVEDKLGKNLTEEAIIVKKAENDIKGSPEWAEICKQFSYHEQEIFLYHWREIVSQFKNDVTHTEKLQIIDCIRTEILLSRVLEKINLVQQEVVLKNQKLEEEYSKLEDKDTTEIIRITNEIAAQNAAIGAYNKELKELSDSKKQIIREIKGTREQRVKRVEESKETLTSWVSALISDVELRKKLGEEMERHRIAAEVEYIRLTDYFTFADGEVEQPILNAEDIKDDNA